MRRRRRRPGAVGAWRSPAARDPLPERASPASMPVAASSALVAASVGLMASSSSSPGALGGGVTLAGDPRSRLAVPVYSGQACERRAVCHHIQLSASSALGENALRPRRLFMSAKGARAYDLRRWSCSPRRPGSVEIDPPACPPRSPRPHPRPPRAARCGGCCWRPACSRWSRVLVSYATAMLEPSNSSLGIRSVEWLRDHGAAGW